MADPLFFAKALQYYKRREVQEAMLRHCQNREVSPRYGEGFGKRPDILTYPNDILEFAKRKTTSFHVSEERWDNPLSIKTGASRKELNELRIGWDLVLDIDAKDWDVSRLAAWLCISVLQDHGVKCISCKFSGSKGWHIGVPFESFPQTFFDELAGTDLQTKDFFPELPRAIASYLMDYLSDTAHGYVRQEGADVIFGRAQPTGSHVPLRMPLTVFAAKFGKTPEELFETYCPGCKQAVKEKETYQLVCMNADCQHHSPQRYTKEESLNFDDNELSCPKCGSIRRFSLVKTACPHDKKSYERRFNMTDIIQVDTILLAGRHLYRMPYSLHEKSGLASLVIDPAHVLSFEKAEADPKTIAFERTFLDITNVNAGEATDLMRKAWIWQQQKDELKQSRMKLTEFETVGEAITEEHFPPCIQNILGGMADGKKRAMFALTNFFSVCGWSAEMIEKRLHEWNEKNPEPLREVTIKGHMHSVRMKKDRILPPNCKSFYQELGVCKPNEFCSRSKNPAQHAIKHVALTAPKKTAKAKKAIKEEAVAEQQAGGGPDGSSQ